MLKDIELSEFLCAKFCHDLAGPIGAINNGIDFFESDNEQMKEKAYELVRMSAKQAVNRLTFFRQAYGNIVVDNEIHLMELKFLILKFMEDSKLQLDFLDSTSDNNEAIANYQKALELEPKTNIFLSNFIFTIITTNDWQKMKQFYNIWEGKPSFSCMIGESLYQYIINLINNKFFYFRNTFNNIKDFDFINIYEVINSLFIGLYTYKESSLLNQIIEELEHDNSDDQILLVNLQVYKYLLNPSGFDINQLHPDARAVVESILEVEKQL